MEFFEIRHGAAARPTVRAAKSVVTVTIPGPIAEHYGLLSGQKVRVLFGREGEDQAVRLVVDPTAPWILVSHKAGLVLNIPEIYPTLPVSETTAEFQAEPYSITIMLPRPWRLSAEHTIVAPAKGVSPAGRAPKQAGRSDDLPDENVLEPKHNQLINKVAAA